MDLNKKAETAASTELTAAPDSEGTYRLETTDLTSADELTDEDSYPEFGDWLEVSDGEDRSLFLECPGGLAAELVELELEPGDCFEIGAVRKVENTWQYAVRDIDETDLDGVVDVAADDWAEQVW